MKNKKIDWKKICMKGLPSFVFLICSAVPFILMKQTLNSKLNSWSNQFNNYYVENSVSREMAPMIRIQSNDKNTLPDLYANFYYTNSSTVNYSFRQFYPGESYFTSYYGVDHSICLNKQTGFNIGDKYDWGYYLDNGLFSTYFKDEVLPNKGYWVRRYKADAVCFISDTLADKLAVEYGIVDAITDDNRIQAYEKLIKPEDPNNPELDSPFLPLLELKIGDESKGIKFCINNILYSEYRTGPRVQQLYGDFCVMFGEPYTDNQLKYCAEFDMKNDIYGNSSFIKRVDALGYNKSNSDFTFYRFDNSECRYHEVVELKTSFENINFSQDDTLLYIFSAITSLACVCFVFIWKKDIFIQLILITSLFTAYNLIICFVFIEPLCNLFAVINYLAVLIVFGSRILLQKMKKNRRKGGDFVYEEISI